MCFNISNVYLGKRFCKNFKKIHTSFALNRITLNQLTFSPLRLNTLKLGPLTLNTLTLNSPTHSPLTIHTLSHHTPQSYKLSLYNMLVMSNVIHTKMIYKKKKYILTQVEHTAHKKPILHVENRTTLHIFLFTFSCKKVTICIITLIRSLTYISKQLVLTFLNYFVKIQY